MANWAGTNDKTATSTAAPRPVQDSTSERRSTGSGSSLTGSGEPGAGEMSAGGGGAFVTRTSLPIANAGPKLPLSSLLWWKVRARRPSRTRGDPVTDDQTPWMRLLRELFGDDAEAALE